MNLVLGSVVEEITNTNVTNTETTMETIQKNYEMLFVRGEW